MVQFIKYITFYISVIMKIDIFNQELVEELSKCTPVDNFCRYNT